MFTGLIQKLCQVKSIDRTGRTMRLKIDLGQLDDDVKIGDSVAVNGCCLTVTELAGPTAGFDISAETIEKTNLGKLAPGKNVNIEPALKPTDRLGGHFVSGHIDGTAKITAIEKQDRFANIKFKAPPELLEQMIPKGSVAVDGISLTIAAMDNESFTVALIPETLAKTTLGSANLGDSVNIETDIIVKSVRKYLGTILPKSTSLTIDKLMELGF
jgi:riboflavin synthase